MSAAPTSPALAGLIGEGAAGAFLRESFGRDAWRTRIGPEAAAALFNWRRLNDALSEHRLEPPRLRLERKGAPVASGVWRARSGAPGRVLEAAPFLAELRDGATLILDAASELSAPLNTLCAGLSADFTCFCQANLYASWGETRGFDVHWDDHDVLVVQAEGRKRWALYGQTRVAPVVRDDPPDHVAPVEPRETLVLEAGDLLYLPRGYWHAAVGVGEPSLHLTIGLTRRTGSEFLHWLADHLLSDARVRADLPFEEGEAAVGRRLGELLAEIAGQDPDALARLYRRHIEASLGYRPKLSLAYLGGTETALKGEDRFKLADGAARLEPGPDQESVVLSWRGVRFTVSAALAEPLRALAAGQSASLASFLSAGSEPGKAFAREMLGRGVFVLQPTQ